MTDTLDQSNSLSAFRSFVGIAVAALAMVATLPGRTVGLSLITEPLLQDLSVTRTHYANMTFWATILGAGVSLICGRAIDRWGVRRTLAATLLIVGLVTVGMSRLLTVASLPVFLLLARGFGQSGLSTVSVTAIGKWFSQRLELSLGLFSALVAVGFTIAIPVIGESLRQSDWRQTWGVIGVSILVLAVVSPLLVPSSSDTAKANLRSTGHSTRWTDAMQTPAFWVLSLSTAVYYLVLSGLTLFSEAVLAELGFDNRVFITAMAAMVLAGLLGNFLAGWLASLWRVTGLLAVTLLLLSLVLLSFPLLTSVPRVVILFAGYGVCGGSFAVLFFAGFSQAFGRQHLGKIQGTAQVLGVVASALGPKILAETQAATGSYLPALWWLGLTALLFAGVAWITPLPAPRIATQLAGESGV